MEIILKRMFYTNMSTIGRLTLDSAFECSTLEDTVRANQPKVPGATAIPRGRYEVVINFSERFKKPMPLLLNVKDFEGVRIHSGNADKDTEGCILLGIYDPRIPDYISESRACFARFFGKLETALKTEKAFISIC